MTGGQTERGDQLTGKGTSLGASQPAAAALPVMVDSIPTATTTSSAGIRVLPSHLRIFGTATPWLGPLHRICIGTAVQGAEEAESSRGRAGEGVREGQREATSAHG